jgi:hypothetical protein
MIDLKPLAAPRLGYVQPTELRLPSGGGWFNGKTADSDSANHGSNPGPSDLQREIYRSGRQHWPFLQTGRKWPFGPPHEPPRRSGRDCRRSSNRAVGCRSRASPTVRSGGDSSTPESRTLTPLIMVRIQVAQPQNLSIPLRICSFRGLRNVPILPRVSAPANASAANASALLPGLVVRQARQLHRYGAPAGQRGEQTIHFSATLANDNGFGPILLSPRR